ncbi:MAG: hypothetical protein PWP57_902 [Candidatus Atribacteria bacterium]|nr:hypothetical protein [Candidatus Atribacteria bacterium]
MKNQHLKGMLVAIILLFLSSSAFSQGGITFSPLSVDLELAPGSRSDLSFNIINETEKEVYFSCFVADVRQGEWGEYLPVIEAKDSLAFNPRISCSNWIKLRDQKIVVPPLQRKEIKAELIVPGSVSPGSYVAMVVLQSENQETNQSSTVEGAMPAMININLQAGGVVFLQVHRRGVRQTRTGKYGEIEKFEVVKEQEGLKFVATLSNRGKNFIEGKGQLVISKEGKKIIDSPLGSGRGRVIPGNKINFVTLVTKPLPPGEYSALALIDYGGISTAQAQVSFNIKGEIVESATFEKKLSAIEEPISITLKDDLIESKILPHSNRNFTIPVYNDSSRSLIIETSVRDVSNIESTKFSPYVRVTPAEFDIPPHKSKVVKITINSPDELTDGNKYVKVDFVPKKAGAEPLSEELQQSFSTSAFLILYNIKGEKKEEVSIKNIEVNLIEERKGELRPQIVINYLNTGNVHINPSCSITLSEIIDEKAREKGAVAVMPAQTISLSSSSNALDVVLPGMESSLVLDSRTPIKPGKFQAEITIKNEGKEILKETKTFEIK